MEKFKYLETVFNRGEKCDTKIRTLIGLAKETFRKEAF